MLKAILALEANFHSPLKRLYNLLKSTLDFIYVEYLSTKNQNVSKKTRRSNLLLEAHQSIVVFRYYQINASSLLQIRS